MTDISIPDDLKTTKTGLVKHKENPFLEKEVLTIRVKNRRVGVASGTALVDTKTGETVGTTTIAQKIEVDAEEFIKLYTKDITVYFELSPSGIKTFAILLREVQGKAINRDKVFFKYDHIEFPDGIHLSQAVFYRGIQELVKKQFIAKAADPNWYFLNPSLIFNGDRARFVKEYHIQRGTKYNENAKAFMRMEMDKFCQETGKSSGELTSADHAIIERRTGKRSASSQRDGVTLPAIQANPPAPSTRGGETACLSRGMPLRFATWGVAPYPKPTLARLIRTTPPMLAKGLQRGCPQVQPWTVFVVVMVYLQNASQFFGIAAFPQPTDWTT